MPASSAPVLVAAANRTFPRLFPLKRVAGIAHAAKRAGSLSHTCRIAAAMAATARGIHQPVWRQWRVWTAPAICATETIRPLWMAAFPSVPEEKYACVICRPLFRQCSACCSFVGWRPLAPAAKTQVRSPAKGPGRALRFRPPPSLCRKRAQSRARACMSRSAAGMRI